MIEKPHNSEIPEYMQGYISLVEQNHLSLALHQSLDDLHLFLQQISENKAGYRYAKDKWSIKDILQHLIDAERVFIYRVLRFAREGYNNIEGYDQNVFVEKANADKRSLKDLKEEFIAVRKSSIYLLNSLNEESLLQKGKASGFDISVRTLGFAIVGHSLHHFKVIKEKYL